MIRSLTIDNFRGFDHFELHDLGRVNLIVGTNNSGKTSVLEAVDLVSANGDASVLSRILARRGEDIEYIDRLKQQDTSRIVTRQLDVRRLFRGHQLQLGSQIKLHSMKGDEQLSFIAEVLQASEKEDFHVSELTDPGEVPSLAFRAYWGTNQEFSFRTGVLPQGGVSAYRFYRSRRRYDGKPSTTKLIPAASLSADEVIDLFDEIVLTPEEDTVIRALKIIEPTVERLATQRTESGSGRSLRTNHRGGILLRLSDMGERIPIGSMGDGMWRLLGLALCLIRSANGILLIDEIDTGLHYSVMEKMWTLVTRTAKELNIQVFATSHSSDCYQSLAAVSRESVTDNSEVTIQRVERGKKRAVAYTEREIVIAANRGLEVR